MSAFDQSNHGGKRLDLRTVTGEEANASERLIAEVQKVAQSVAGDKNAAATLPAPSYGVTLPPLTLTNDLSSSTRARQSARGDLSSVGGNAAADKLPTFVAHMAGGSDLEPGDRINYNGQSVKFLAANHDCTVAILQRDGATPGASLVVNATPADVAQNCTAVPLVDRYVYVNKDGAVFESVGRGENGYQLKELKDLVGVAPAQLEKTVRKPTWEADEKFEKAFSNRAGEWKDTKAKETVDGQKIRVVADSKGTRRKYIAGGKEYELHGNGLWYKHFGMPGPDGPLKGHGDVKLHITTTGNTDLKRVQAAIIPALEEAVKPGGALFGKVYGYKTHDPMYGFVENWGEKEICNKTRPLGTRMEPGPTGQGAKGLTIYPASDQHAQEVAEFCSKVLADKKLALPGPQSTGNLADRNVDKATHRVGLERDQFKGCRYGVQNLWGAAILDEPLEKAMRKYAEGKVRDGASEWLPFKDPSKLYEGDPKDGRLSRAALRQICTDAKVDKECGLVYGNDETIRGEKTIPGNGKGKLAFYSGEVYLKDSGRYYLEEAGAQKEPVYERGRMVKGLTDRPAFYELTKVVGDYVGQDLNPTRLLLDATATAAVAASPNQRPRPDRVTPSAGDFQRSDKVIAPDGTVVRTDGNRAGHPGRTQPGVKETVDEKNRTDGREKDDQKERVDRVDTEESKLKMEYSRSIAGGLIGASILSGAGLAWWYRSLPAPPPEQKQPDRAK